MKLIGKTFEVGVFSMLTHGIQLEITRLRDSSKHDLNIYQFNYHANTRSGGFLQKAHIRKARTAKRYESI